jgi:hypothetical protein
MTVCARDGYALSLPLLAGARAKLADANAMLLGGNVDGARHLVDDVVASMQPNLVSAEFISFLVATELTKRILDMVEEHPSEFDSRATATKLVPARYDNPIERYRLQQAWFLTHESLTERGDLHELSFLPATDWIENVIRELGAMRELARLEEGVRLAQIAVEAHDAKKCTTLPPLDTALYRLCTDAPELSRTRDRIARLRESPHP